MIASGNWGLKVRFGANSTTLAKATMSLHVRSTPNTGRKFNAPVHVALCHIRTHAPQQKVFLTAVSASVGVGAR
jgi:hypothetical protein